MRMTASSLPALSVKQALVFSVNSGWTAAGQAVISVISGVERGSFLEIQIAVWFAPDCQSGAIRGRKDARVAQLVEQRTENPRVGGSNPPPGTTFSQKEPRFAVQVSEFLKLTFEERQGL